MAYFLPRQLVRVSATRTGGKLSDAVDGVIKARSDVEGAKAKVVASNSAIRATEDLIIAASGGDAGKLILAARLKTQQGELETNTKAVTDKEAAQTKAEAALKSLVSQPAVANSGPGSYKVALKIELLPPSADPSLGYRLSPRHTIFRDDEHKLTISSGLLTTSNITATDRTGDMLVEIATFAGAIQGNAFAGGSKGKSDRDPVATKNCATSPSEYAGVVDFVDAASVLRLNGDLQCLGVKLVPEGQYWPGSSKPAAGGETSVYSRSIEGIVYRSPIEVQVRIEKCLDAAGACIEGDPDWHVSEVIALSLPQAGPISFLRQDSGLLTKTKYDVAFKDGVPIDYSGSRPSEILEVGRLPLRLVNGFFDGFSKVLSLRTGQNNDKAALVTSQMALLNSQSALQVAAVQGKTNLSAADLALLNQQNANLVAAIQGKTTLSAADLALLQAQGAYQVAGVSGQTNLTIAQIAQIQQQFALQAASRTGATSLTTADLAALQAQVTLAVAQNSSASQLLASDRDLVVARLRDQALRESLNRCVAEKLQAAQPIDACLSNL